MQHEQAQKLSNGPSEQAPTKQDACTTCPFAHSCPKGRLTLQSCGLVAVAFAAPYLRVNAVYSCAGILVTIVFVSVIVTAIVIYLHTDLTCMRRRARLDKKVITLMHMRLLAGRPLQCRRQEKGDSVG